MPIADHDVAFLVRMRMSRERAALAALKTTGVGGPPTINLVQMQTTARSHWPACIARLGALAMSYQSRSEALGVVVEVEELIRLRVWLPDVAITFSRADRELATKVVFRMTREGRTFCRIQQTRGALQSNLNRQSRPIYMSERNLRLLFKAIVHILIVK